jgi:hypothetical protein
MIPDLCGAKHRNDNGIPAWDPAAQQCNFERISTPEILMTPSLSALAM